MAATQTYRRHSKPIREAVQAAKGSPLKIDRDAGIIFGCKLLGLTSPNSHNVAGAKSTRYKPEALEAAKPLYENADVFLNHRERNAKINSDDPAEEKLGILRNVRMSESGLIGDYHYLKSHDFNNRIVEDAERGLGVYSFSHDANGEGPVENGVFLIERITEVRRVDIVSRGATNRNLWESQSMSTKRTFRRLVKEHILSDGISKNRIAWAMRLLEQPYMEEKPVQEQDPIPVGGLEVDAPAAETDPDAALKAGFESALMACVKAALDGDDESLKKISELIKTHRKLSTKAEPEAPAKESTEEEKKETKESDEEEKKKETKESLQRDAERREFETLKANARAVQLWEQLAPNIKPSPSHLKATAAMQEADRRQYVLDVLAEKNRPRSTAPHNIVPVVESTDDSKRFAKVVDAKSFMAARLN